MVWNHFRHGLIDPQRLMTRLLFSTALFLIPAKYLHQHYHKVHRRYMESTIPADRRDIHIDRILPKLSVEYDNSFRHRDDYEFESDLKHSLLGQEHYAMKEKQHGEDLLVVLIGDAFTTIDAYRPFRDELMRRFPDNPVHIAAIQRYGYGFDKASPFAYHLKNIQNQSKIIDRVIEYFYKNDLEKVDTRTTPLEALGPAARAGMPSEKALEAINAMATVDGAAHNPNLPAKNDSPYRRRILFVGHGLGGFYARAYMHGVAMVNNDQVGAVLIDPLTEYHGDSKEWCKQELKRLYKHTYQNYCKFGLIEWMTYPHNPFTPYIRRVMLNHFLDFPPALQAAMRYSLHSRHLYDTGQEEMGMFKTIIKPMEPKKLSNITLGRKYPALIVQAERYEDCDREHNRPVDDRIFPMIAKYEFMNDNAEESIVHLPNNNHFDVLFTEETVNAVERVIREFFPPNPAAPEGSTRTEAIESNTTPADSTTETN